MKVDGPGSAKSPGSVRKAGKATRSGGASFRNSLGDAEPADGGEAVAASAAASVGAAESLLALQEVDAAGDALTGGGNRRAFSWGEDMLDALDGVRTGLLLGIIPADKLEELAQSASDRKVQAEDPKLAAILDEIELRARVELAKLQR